MILCVMFVEVVCERERGCYYCRLRMRICRRMRQCRAMAWMDSEVAGPRCFKASSSCLRGVGRCFLGLSDPQRHSISVYDRGSLSILELFNNWENTLSININASIYNFAFAGPSVSAFSLSFSTLLKIFPLTLLGISSTNFTPPLSFL